jgi:hypothetical protein
MFFISLVLSASARGLSCFSALKKLLPCTATIVPSRLRKPADRFDDAKVQHFCEPTKRIGRLFRIDFVARCI